MTDGSVFSMARKMVEGKNVKIDKMLVKINNYKESTKTMQ